VGDVRRFLDAGPIVLVSSTSNCGMNVMSMADTR